MDNHDKDVLFLSYQTICQNVEILCHNYHQFIENCYQFRDYLSLWYKQANLWHASAEDRQINNKEFNDFLLEMHRQWTSIDETLKVINPLDLHRLIKDQCAKITQEKTVLIAKGKEALARKFFYTANLSDEYSLRSFQSMLSRAQVSANVQNAQGDSLLHLAVYGNHVLLIGFLLHCGADPNLKNIHAETPLTVLDFQGNSVMHQLIHQGYFEQALVLLEKCDPNLRSCNEAAMAVIHSRDKYQGNTLLHYVLYRIDNESPNLPFTLLYELFADLLGKGALLGIENNDKQSVWQRVEQIRVPSKKQKIRQCIIETIFSQFFNDMYRCSEMQQDVLKNVRLFEDYINALIKPGFWGWFWRLIEGVRKQQLYSQQALTAQLKNTLLSSHIQEDDFELYSFLEQNCMNILNKEIRINLQKSCVSAREQDDYALVVKEKLLSASINGFFAPNADNGLARQGKSQGHKSYRLLKALNKVNRTIAANRLLNIFDFLITILE